MFKRDPKITPVFFNSQVVSFDGGGGNAWAGSISSNVVQAFPTQQSLIFVEPAMAQGLDVASLSDMGDIIMVTGRSGGSGTWTGNLVFERFDSDDVWPTGSLDTIDPDNPLSEVPIGVQGSVGGISFYKDGFPTDFMRSDPATATNTNSFVCRFWVRPGSADVVNLFWAMVMIPNRKTPSRPGRGNVFSGRGW